MEQPILIISTVDSEEAGAELVRSLVNERLIACGNLIPGARSIYLWKGEVEDSSEVIIIMKSTASKKARLEARFNELHSYDVPEFVVIKPDSLSVPYGEWIVESLKEDS